MRNSKEEEAKRKTREKRRRNEKPPWWTRQHRYLRQRLEGKGSVRFQEGVGGQTRRRSEKGKKSTELAKRKGIRL